MIARRIFLKHGGLAAVGLSVVPSFLHRTVFAANPEGRGRKKLVVIFQRGGADGLNIVVPFKEKAYYKYRPTIALPAPGKEENAALDLDGQFGLHPALQPLLPFYKNGQLAVIHAVGSPNTGNRSHFAAQDLMESGTARAESTGWVNRYLQHAPDSKANTFRATSLGTVLPKALRGPASTMALGGLTQFDVKAAGALYESLYNADSNSLLTGTASEMFEAFKMLKEANLEQYQPADGVNYRQAGPLGQSLQQVAQLIKADIGVEVAFVDVGDWDHHTREQERLQLNLQRFGRALAAFHKDLGDLMEDTVVLTISEFGRTARENGGRGTDHGHANMMFVLGGPVKGGKVCTQWPGLEPEQLNENRDLALTTDFRDVFAELLVGHLGCKNPEAVFPTHPIDCGKFKGLI